MKAHAINVTQLQLTPDLGEIAEARAAFIDFLLSLGIADTEKEGWKLVFTEMLNNAIEHGDHTQPDDCVMVEWYQTQNKVILIVENSGNGPDDATLKAPQLPEDPLAEGGRGLFIIHSFIDSWSWRRGTNRFALSVEKTYPHLNYTLPINREAEEILDELSDCYENLTLFHRLADALRQQMSFGQLLIDTVSLFLEAGGYAIAHIEIAPDANEPEFDGLQHLHIFNALQVNGPSLSERLGAKPDCVWQADAPDSPTDVRDNSPTHGCAVPILDRNRLAAVLAIANPAESPQFQARDIRNLQSLAEIIGVALTRAITDRETTAHRIVEHEFGLAKQLQRQLLGDLATHQQQNGLELFARILPAAEIAGDHAEFLFGPDGKLYFSVIDVMGKGVNAAMLAGIYRSHFLTWVQQHPDAPGAFLGRVSNALETQLSGQVLFITAFAGCLDPASGRIHYAGAGHPPALRIGPQQNIVQLPSGGPPLGVIAHSHYPTETIDLPDQHSLMVITDGLYEWTTAQAAPFGFDALVEWCQSHPITSAQSFADQLFQLMTGHAADGHNDDRTLLLIKRNLS